MKIRVSKIILARLATLSLAVGLVPFSLLWLSFPIFAGQNDYAKALDTFKVEQTTTQETLQLDAKIEAVKSATVSAQTSGRIVAIHYDVNDQVLAGAALLEITSIEQGAQLLTAEAQLEQANAVNAETQNQLARYKTLFPQGAISQGAMDEMLAKAKSSQQAVNAAEAQLTKAKENVKYTVVKAPFSGRVTQRHVEVGETISFGQPLFSGYNDEALRAVFYVPEQFHGAMTTAPTQIQFVSTTSSSTPLTSDMVSMFAFSQNNNNSAEVRAEFSLAQVKTHQLRLGQWLKAKWPIGKRETIFIPSSAIVKQGELSAIYRIYNDRVLLTQIRLASRSQGQDTNDQQVEVISGLRDGDIVIKDAARYISTRSNNE